MPCYSLRGSYHSMGMRGKDAPAVPKIEAVIVCYDWFGRRYAEHDRSFAFDARALQRCTSLVGHMTSAWMKTLR